MFDRKVPSPYTRILNWRRFDASVSSASGRLRHRTLVAISDESLSRYCKETSRKEGGVASLP
ncbi:hypothetical protein OF83DRAFT_1105127 [Amylostereum chailletii]|nr:hypothetical protein OF83DRAFT_1105127 [Amylostereum chailletii]